MRFVSLRTPEGPHLGVVIVEQVVDLAAGAVRALQSGLPIAVREVFEAPQASAVAQLAARFAGDAVLRQLLAAAGAVVPLAEADLGPPVDDPALLLAIGMNYRDHVREMNASIPEVPYSFTKNRAALTGPRDDIVLPAAHADQVDLEAELVIVIGRPCFAADEREAEAAIGGYTIANDVSARDWIPAVFSSSGAMDAIGKWEQNLLGKQYPTFCPLGPYLVTADEIADVGRLAIRSRVNGEPFQTSSTTQLIFSPPALVAYYSQFYRFEPGDLVLTGTPAGVGFGRTPKRFLADGDVVEVEIEGLGMLANRVTRNEV